MGTAKKAKDIGILVRERRKRLGLLQSDAAGLLGVGVRFLSELERGKETLFLGKVLAVLEGLGLVVHIESKEDAHGDT